MQNAAEKAVAKAPEKQEESALETPSIPERKAVKETPKKSVAPVSVAHLNPPPNRPQTIISPRRNVPRFSLEKP